MKHVLIIDRRVAGIIHWLERLKQSYSSGALEIALMDAECARADLEDLRQDVWSKVQPVETREKKFFSRLINFSKIAFLAVLVVLLMVVPIAKEVRMPVTLIEHEESKLEEKSEQTKPVLIVQEIKDYKEDKAVSSKPKKSNANKSSAPRKNAASSQNSNMVAKADNVNVKNSAKPEKTVAYDKVFSLVQTGQRALKNNSSVIEIK